MKTNRVATFVASSMMTLRNYPEIFLLHVVTLLIAAFCMSSMAVNILPLPLLFLALAHNFIVLRSLYHDRAEIHYFRHMPLTGFAFCLAISAMVSSSFIHNFMPVWALGYVLIYLYPLGPINFTNRVGVALGDLYNKVFNGWARLWQWAEKNSTH